MTSAPSVSPMTHRSTSVTEPHSKAAPCLALRGRGGPKDKGRAPGLSRVYPMLRERQKTRSIIYLLKENDLSTGRNEEGTEKQLKARKDDEIVSGSLVCL